MPTDLATIAVEQQTSTVNGPAGGDPRTAASVTQMGQPLTNRSKWLWKRLQQVIGTFAPIANDSPTQITSVDVSTDAFTLNGHGLVDTNPIRFQTASGGSLPSGVSEGTVYFVTGSTSNTFQVSATSGGGAIDLTGSLSGACYVVKVTDAAANLYLPASGSLPAGTLRTILGLFGLLGTANTWSATNTFTGAVNLSNAGGNNTTLGHKLIRSGTGTRDVYRQHVYSTPGATMTVETTKYDTVFIPEPSADCTATMEDGDTAGQRVLVVASTAYGTHKVDLVSAASTKATFPSGATRCSVLMEWGGSNWFAVMWTKDVTNI